MKLSEMFDHAPEIEIEELSFDSRIKTKNSIFFCVSGINSDGQDVYKRQGEIALQCGMQNVQYFCMKFKQLTAMRPQEYRQINQK